MEQVITFDPTVENLHAIVAETSAITVTDLSNEQELALVHSTRIKLRDARITIEKQGKGMRESALKYQKDVIARERELIGIIEPEETRLKAIEEEATAMKERQSRLALLPMRREQLKGLEETPSLDGFLLTMDNDEFITYLSGLALAKVERDRKANEAEAARLAHEAQIANAAEEARIAEKARADAEAKAMEEQRAADAAKVIEDAKAEAARVEELARLEREAKNAAAKKIVDDALAAAAKAEQDAKDRIAKEDAQREAAKREAEVEAQRIKDDAAKAEAQEKYLTWAKAQGWTTETARDYKTEHTVDGIVLWKKVGTYTE